jgi:ABC-2 type transport system ATP-binding protein
VREIVEGLKARGTSVLLNSHLLSEVERTCDEVAILRAGRIVRQGTVEQIAAPSTSVTIELEALTPALLEAAARLSTFAPPEPNANVFTALIPADAKIPDLVAALVAAGGRIRAVTPIRETLEDIFVRVMEE